MPASIKIRRSQLPRTIGLLKNLGLILSGRLPDQLGIREAFWGSFIHTLSLKISASFYNRAAGSADDLGNTWPPLAPSTLARRLRPSLTKKFPLASQGLILRLSDDLYKSLSPGTFDGARYTPSDNQQFEISSRGIRFGSTLPYANKQDATRPLIPENIDPWIEAALDVASETILPLIQLQIKTQ